MTRVIWQPHKRSIYDADADVDGSVKPQAVPQHQALQQSSSSCSPMSRSHLERADNDNENDNDEDEDRETAGRRQWRRCEWRRRQAEEGPRSRGAVAVQWGAGFTTDDEDEEEVRGGRRRRALQSRDPVRLRDQEDQESTIEPGFNPQPLVMMMNPVGGRWGVLLRSPGLYLQAIWG
jgi:hypothetical protein